MNKENLLVKFSEKPLKNSGKFVGERSFLELLDNSFIIIDKDAGYTSHQTADFLKKILNVEKAGHSGTLDPNVTGVLVCGINKATRLMEYMLKSNKEYVCLMYVHKETSIENIKDAFKKFTGKIMQMPPVVSAVKRELREREIYYINLIDFDETCQNILFRVGCQHGTYIRKLCSDIGEYIEKGAHMKELRRTKAGPFTENDSIISLDKLRNLYELYILNDSNKDFYEKQLRNYIRPVEELLKDYKKVYVRNSAVDRICHGSDLAIPGVSMLENNIDIGETVAMFTLKEELIGIGIAFMTSQNVIKKDKGAFVKTKKVLMNVGTYPCVWNFSEDE